ncbi:TonB-linked SusC/RagA family outer membrane protein [Pedobacter metabolipauper]|uniref:TonB-linked SusC/RagA family outer membrane protein n=2 Tax=Pedobacter metabolipauper TaxID=425513 RepID=A0A4V3D0N5_9SPHI|nr:TonB-linked SusC/RagA family outer membrane protein [Pedobacter metabolipauper]
MKEKYLITLLLCLLLSVKASAQTTVTGTVKDEKNLPVPAATVLVKGTKNTVMTNENGKFSISAPADAILVVSSIGYAKMEYKLAGRNAVTITLEESMSDLNDVLVVGYQKIIRRKSTSAISSISSKELANLPSSSFDQLLQGRLSGVNVQNFSGMPGASPTVSVRGTSAVNLDYDEYNVLSSPLYVVDGVPQPAETFVSPNTGTGTNYLAGINPNDIESIDVLKDASAAAIYGSRAANGVILITTKKGTSSEPKVMVSFYGGLTQRPELRDVTLGSTERRQKMAILLNQLDYAGQKNLPYILTDSLNPAFNANTNWQDMFYREGIIKNADVSLSGGGNGGMTYRFSSGFYDEEGIIKGTGFTRYSMRLNLASKALNQKLTINPIISFSRSDRARGNGNNASPISLSAGSMPSSLLNLSSSKRDYYLGKYDESIDQNTSNQLTVNFNLGYDFSKKFKFTSQSSYIGNSARRDQSSTNILENNQGNYSYSYADNSIGLLTSNFLTFSDEFNKHSLSIVAGQDIQYNQSRYTTASGAHGASDYIQVIQGFQQANISAYSDYNAEGLLSYYGRLSYDYNSKYLLSMSARTDGSSRFGKNNKWGFFPAVSAGWLLSEENFIKDNFGKISMIKIRGSIGTTGSLPGQNYLQYSLYNVNAGGYTGNGDATSYNGVTAITPNFYNGVAQDNLSWEKSMQWNFGTDVEISDGKYSFSFDVFNKENTFKLFSVTLPVTTGYDMALTNAIGVRNSGADATIAVNPLSRQSAIKWNSRLNISYVKNKIMSLPNGGRDLVLSGGRFDKSHILSVGQPINAFYLYRTRGVFATDADVPVNPYTGDRYGAAGNAFRAGDFYFEDVDGDYNIDPFNDGINPDKVPIGDPNPKWTGGFSNYISYKNFGLNVFCTFAFDRDVLNLFESDQFSNSASGNAANFANFSTPDLDKINIWRNPGDNATYAKYEIGSYRYYYASSQTFFLEKGGYFRVKSITLSYDLNQPAIKRLGLGRLRFWATADNVAVFQQSKKLPDAEAVNPYGEYSGAGYPIPKKFTLGLEVQF